MKFVAVLAAAGIVTGAARMQQPQFKAGVDVVRVDVSVTDHGKPVRNLTGANFVVTDNGTSEPVASVTLERLPLRVVLVLDTSASVEGSAMATLLDASRGLVGALKPTDRIAVLAVSDDVKLVTGFDAARSAALDTLARVRAGGSTSLYDALQVAFELVQLDEAGGGARPLIIVCTDGLDTASWLSGDDAVQAARRADVVVHVIDPSGSPAYGLAKHIDTVAQVSGGHTWPATSERDLKELFTATLTEMRDRYLLTFSPQTPAREGWHDLKVTLKNAHGDVLARPGYYVANNGKGHG
ncbi:MAG TPA: VWA domain-containing protein [Vicinamibacterales bacterium]|jgi:VWFA-related protein|nr:VWA domain-containing protein [Vicinamibacterales bacterium]